MSKKTWILFIIILVCVIGLISIGMYMVSDPKNSSFAIGMKKLDTDKPNNYEIPDLNPKLALVCIERLFGVDAPKPLNDSQKEMVVKCHEQQLENLELAKGTMEIINQRENKELKYILKTIMVTCGERNTRKYGIDFIGLNECFDDALSKLEESIKNQGDEGGV